MHFTLMWFEKTKKIDEKNRRIKNLPLASEKNKNKPLGVCDIKNKREKKNPNNRET